MPITLRVEDDAIIKAAADIVVNDDWFVELPVPDPAADVLTGTHQESLLSAMYVLTTEYDVFAVEGMPAAVTDLSVDIGVRDYADEEGDRMITLTAFVDWTDTTGQERSVQTRIFDFGLTIELFRGRATIADQLTAYAHHVVSALNEQLQADHDGWAAITAA